MIEHGVKLPVIRQVEMLGLSRSSAYYKSVPVPELDLVLMRRIDELHLERPFMGARMLRLFLQRDGYVVGRRHVGTLMRQMGIEALYRKRNTSKKHPDHQVFPYLLRNVLIDRPNQGVGGGHHVHPDAPRVHLSLRDSRLGNTQGSRVVSFN